MKTTRPTYKLLEGGTTDNPGLAVIQALRRILSWAPDGITVDTATAALMLLGYGPAIDALIAADAPPEPEPAELVESDPAQGELFG